jgi:hypothetical protein
MEPELMLTPPVIEVRDLVTKPPVLAAIRPIGAIPGVAAVATMPARHRQLYRFEWTAARDRRAIRIGRAFARLGDLGPDVPIVRVARRAARQRADDSPS